MRVKEEFVEVVPSELDVEIKKIFEPKKAENFLKAFPRLALRNLKDLSIYEKEQRLKRTILEEGGETILNFISEQTALQDSGTILLTSSCKNASRVLASAHRDVKTVIDLGVINYKNDLNQYFEHVNAALPDAGMFIGCIESIKERSTRMKGKYKFMYPFYHLYDFVVNRVLARVSYTKPLYQFLTGGKYFVISKAEVLGRLSHAGFEVIDHKEANNLFYFSVMKTGLPSEEKNIPTGMLIKMKRISKDGKIVGIYKVRTMHPYSQYIQDYVVKMNGYNKVGKPNSDFRITKWGKVLRKLHVDEMPQLLNLFKGELNLVGVRPLTQFGFQSLPEDLQKDRIKFKPGCIPPNVALGLTGFDGVIKAERIYLRSRNKYGIFVNFQYFWMAVYNMLLKRKLSA
ncbi:MAG: sugar transferase [Flavobacteriales bacterium]|nr:sugar transferase [Flavobacteriales bacterium]